MLAFLKALTIEIEQTGEGCKGSSLLELIAGLIGEDVSTHWHMVGLA